MKNLYKVIAGGIAVGTMFVLSGCSPKHEDVGGKYQSKPDTLKDCTFTKLMEGNGGSSITVVRCPNSDTTAVEGGKSSKTVAVIEDTINVNGVEYIKK